MTGETSEGLLSRGSRDPRRSESDPRQGEDRHDGRRTHLAGEPLKRFRGAFLSAVGRATLPNGSKLPDELHRHDLRHRRVTTWLAEGNNPVHVKEAMGHSTLAVTMGYTHLSREHLRALTESPTPAPVPSQKRAGERRRERGPNQGQNDAQRSEEG